VAETDEMPRTKYQKFLCWYIRKMWWIFYCL